MKKILILLFLLKSISNFTFGQSKSSNIGIPFLKSFHKKNYQAGTQNWDILQDKRGVIYFANNEGMLQYDGKNWRCYPLPNRTIVRSMALADSGVIFVGGQNELGYFAPNESGDWAFHSLRTLIPAEHQNFEDVWDIVINKEGVFFRASGKLFRFFSNKIEVYLSERYLDFIGLVGGKLIGQDKKTGLVYFENEQLIKIPGTKTFTRSPITAILPIDEGEWLIITLEGWLYKFDGNNFSRWHSSADSFLKQNQIYSAAIFSNKQIALGTSRNGILLLNPDGKAVFHINQERGLLNNNILSLLVDQNQHLWLGLNQGINYVLTNSPFTRIFPDKKAESAGYAVSIFQEKIYFGTSNGLYYTNWKEYYSPVETKQFSLVKNTIGQVWGLDVIEDELLLGHHAGAFRIEKEEAIKISPGWGVWLFNLLDSDTVSAISGSYKGINKLEKLDGHWQFSEKIEGMTESSRFIEQDENGNLWVAHPYKGIYKISLDKSFEKANVELHNSSTGLPTNLSNYVFKINKELIFCTDRGVFTYLENQNKFEPHKAYNQIFGENAEVIRLFEAPRHDIWYVTKTDVGVLEVQEKSIQKEVYRKSFPDLKEYLVNGFEMIYPLDEHNVFIGAENGFIHYNPLKKNRTDTTFQVILSEVRNRGTKDSILFRGLFPLNQQPDNEQVAAQISRFPSTQNAFVFNFSATNYASPDAIEFNCFLEGLEQKWATWTSKSEKEYTNLSAGTYTFHLKARNQTGIKSNELTYSFIILPPWYATSIAFILYIIGILGGVAWFLLYFRKKYRNVKGKMEQSKIEINQLRHDKLQAEIAYKNREITSVTMHLVHKNETLFKIKAALLKIEKQTRDLNIKKNLRQIMGMMKKEEDADAIWEQFTAHFNEIHGGFLTRLSEQYPELSPKDLKMCAYLHQNLSTKEISTLLNITIRGAEGGRYRLRKKMGLDEKANLTEFLMRF